MDDLTQEFIAESQDGLDRMERCLTELETRPQDSQQLVGEIFRAVHTIKGTTGFLGFDRLEKLAHAGEHLLGSLREGRLAVTEELISGLLRLLDGLRAILTLIEETGGEGTRTTDEDSGLIAELAKLNGEETKTPSKEKAAPVVSIKAAEETATPALPEAMQAASSTESRGSASGDKTLRIDVEVLNRMMNLVGELVLTRNQMLQSGVEATNFPELARRLDSVTADLRETVMQARMQPVGNLFGKFPRMVRDLARTCGRDVRIEFSGQETGLDKSLLEAIKDPLTHAVRNAVDHGIEPPADRVLAGKSAEGCLRLRAFHQSGSVVIEVADDGAGIAMERVLAKAVERGLVTPEQAKEMTEREALQLIFLPGFSTAAAVTTVSGRGVGMDVVRANVEKVGGSVELESKVGRGYDAASAGSPDACDCSGTGGAQWRSELRAAAERRWWSSSIFPGGMQPRWWSEWERPRSIVCASGCCRWCGSIVSWDSRARRKRMDSTWRCWRRRAAAMAWSWTTCWLRKRLWSSRCPRCCARSVCSRGQRYWAMERWR